MKTAPATATAETTSATATTQTTSATATTQTASATAIAAMIISEHSRTRYHISYLGDELQGRTAQFLHMELEKNVGDRSRLARTVLTIALALVAIGSLRKGKRLSGLLAGTGAVALGYAATEAESEELTEDWDINTTGEETELRCAACGEPIRPGQRRSPNEDNEIVHDACKVSVE